MPFRLRPQAADNTATPLITSDDDDLFRLVGSVGEQGDNDRQDVIKAQILLGESGYFNLPGLGGPTGWPSGGLSRGMRNYQKDRGLTVDGIMLPGGETVQSLNSELGDRLAGHAVPKPDEVDRQHAERAQQLAQGEPTATPDILVRGKAADHSLSGLGLEGIKQHENLRERIYSDQAGKRTIGYGHLLRPGEEQQFAKGIDEKAARELLAKDVATAEAAVKRLVKVPLSQQEYDALVSLAYNIGQGGFAESTVLKRLNAEDYQAAADAMLMWDKITQNGQKVQSSGLVNRRNSERNLFLNGIYDSGNRKK
ncbi:MAG: glycoside hydrolase family protein [Ferrovibrio sp.]